MALGGGKESRMKAYVSVGVLATPIFDFSHLTPEERIELAEQLWDSLDLGALAPTPEEAAELRRRRRLGGR
jgi:putative addiction module component